MTNGGQVSNEDILGWLVLIAGVVVALIAIFYYAFQAFRFLTFLSLAVLAIAMVHDIYVWYNDSAYTEYWALYPAIAVIVFFILSVISFALFTGLAGSTLGQFSLQFYSAFTGMENAQQEAINQLVNSTCQMVDKSSCNIIKTYASTAQTASDLQDYIDKAETAGKIIKIVHPT